MQTSLVGGSNVPFPKIMWDHQPVVATLEKNEAGLRHPRIFIGNKPNLSLCSLAQSPHASFLHMWCSTRTIFCIWFLKAILRCSSSIWRFPEIGVPPNHPLNLRIFPYKPSILGTPFMDPPIFLDRASTMTMTCTYRGPGVRFDGDLPED